MFSSFFALAQESEKTDIETLFLRLSSQLDEEALPDLSQLQEQWQDLVQNPIPLNIATVDELLHIPLMDEFRAHALIDYRDKSGQIFTYYELTHLRGFSRDFVEYISLLTSLEAEMAPRKKQPFFKGKHQIIARYDHLFQEQRGFENGNYLGPPGRAQLRYRFFGRGNWNWGFTADKDPGEHWLVPGTGLPDFFSAYAEYSGRGTVKRIIIGDYHLNIGQGLAMWTGFAINKSALTTQSSRSGQGLRRYGSSFEANFLRGAAVQLALGEVNLTLYGSHRSESATHLDVEDETYFRTINESGLHRTQSEMNRRRNTPITAGGAHAEWRKGAFKIGMLHQQYRYHVPFRPTIYPQNAPGETITNGHNSSVHATFAHLKGVVFGDLATDHFLRPAVTVGWEVFPHEDWKLVLQYRNLANDYRSLYNNPFGESGQYGEEGLYLGGNYRVGRGTNLNFFVDVYRFKQARFVQSQPGYGKDLFAQFDWQPYRNLLFNIRARWQNRMRDFTEDVFIIPEETHLWRLRLHAKVRVTRQFHWAFRVEPAIWRPQFADETEVGILSFLEAYRTSESQKWQVGARVTTFSTPSFNTVIYTYEQDVPFTFSVPGLSGRGMRSYLIVRYKVTQKTDLWLRLSNTEFFDREEISAGNDLIAGRFRTDMRLMMNVRF